MTWTFYYHKSSDELDKGGPVSLKLIFARLMFSNNFMPE